MSQNYVTGFEIKYPIDEKVHHIKRCICAFTLERKIESNHLHMKIIFRDWPLLPSLRSCKAVSFPTTGSNACCPYSQVSVSVGIELACQRISDGFEANRTSSFCPCPYKCGQGKERHFAKSVMVGLPECPRARAHQGNWKPQRKRNFQGKSQISSR